jgi:hypothetical protein
MSTVRFSDIQQRSYLRVFHRWCVVNDATDRHPERKALFVGIYDRDPLAILGFEVIMLISVELQKYVYPSGHVQGPVV